MSSEKVLSYLGLCKKAGKLVCGTDMAADMIRRGKAVLALTSSDASSNTVKRISDCCKFRSVEYTALPCTTEQTGRAVGRSGGIAALCITDSSFAEMIKKAITQTFQ